MGVTIRDLAERDRVHWERLFRAYLAFYKATVPESVSPVTWARLLSDEPGTHVCYVAVDADDTPFGLTHALFHRSTWVETGHVYLQDLYVDPERRGTGAGRALIERVYAYADDLGATRTHWLTHESNTVARQLYDRIATNAGFLQYRR